VIDYLYEKVRPFCKLNIAPVFNGDNWGTIDKKGYTVIDFKFDRLRDFRCGLAMAHLNGKWIYINSMGETIEIPEFNIIKPFLEIPE